jgi:hypothetical protein
VEHVVSGTNTGTKRKLDEVEKDEDALSAKLLHQLKELLKGIHQLSSLGAATQWFEDQGLSSLAEVKEIKIEKDLVEALQLKPGKATLMLKRISDLKPA